MKVLIIVAVFSVIALVAAKPNKPRDFRRGGFGQGLGRFPKLNCDNVGEVDCSALKEKQLCDQNGEQYRNYCAYLEKNCPLSESAEKPFRCNADGNPLAREERPDSRLERRPFFPNKRELCVLIKNADCSDPALPARKICDNMDGVYNNICEFLQAKCATPELRPAQCPEPTTQSPGDETTEDSQVP
ncbi:uncharacterized protein LOC106153836 [Lingula anatina]|uniref:Uncharacterized protein LOC106153836 n=1 Tax=Lingula anatina TaxID=7574 RepID=A0A1S3HEA4_LINAN|nr:uncharacterized protein LOC106153836 [Lingula anatina]|eukprot:XP_013383399.1 uncharacterized protein LOC106153836 [Lingula anatina]